MLPVNVCSKLLVRITSSSNSTSKEEENGGATEAEEEEEEVKTTNGDDGGKKNDEAGKTTTTTGHDALKNKAAKGKMQGKGWEMYESSRSYEENLDIFITVKKLFDLENPTPKPFEQSFKTSAKMK